MTARKDIWYLPCPFGVRWARELNRLLAKVFTMPYPIRAGKILESRATHHAYLARFIPDLRAHKVKQLFVGHLIADADRDLCDAGFVEKVHGYIHSSVFLPNGGDEIPPERMEAIRHAELAHALLADRRFVGAQRFADGLPYPVIPIGLPLTVPRLPARESNRILFNHRLFKRKGVFDLTRLPDDLARDVYIYAPNFSTPCMEFVNRHFPGRVRIDIPEADYLTALATGGFGISLSVGESFGSAVCEALWSGNLTFVLDAPDVPFREYLPPALLCPDLSTIVDKLRYYRDHFAEKCALVAEAQAALARFDAPAWLTRLLRLLPPP